MLNQPLFAALDVSLETTTICIMSLDGTITKEAVVATSRIPSRCCLGDDLSRSNGLGSKQALFRSGWCANFPSSASSSPCWKHARSELPCRP